MFHEIYAEENGRGKSCAINDVIDDEIMLFKKSDCPGQKKISCTILSFETNQLKSIVKC